MSKLKEIYKLENSNLIIFDGDIGIDLKSDLKIQKKSLFYEDKNLLAEIFYHKNLLHGPVIYYSKAKDILSKSWFFLGKKQGKSYKYYISKKLYSIEQYKDDLMQKEQRYYFEDGSIKTSMNYLAGCLHGEVKLFYEKNKLKRFLIFEKGKKVQDTIFDTKENPIDESKFLV
ncbi:MAG: hypothetical protein KR126chlam4_00467 [Candidatus Anoxychlamydiales bacterium]|nr:hypothetical protein [Candidatus Anoxychlamydiales bacterium]NGX40641.1 hypothetical protein [Candidatus Anoxychlamydiales bacterium]HEU64783.1 hypothetical protein [Chlamydiota bacterium]